MKGRSSGSVAGREGGPVPGGVASDCPPVPPYPLVPSHPPHPQLHQHHLHSLPPLHPPHSYTLSTLCNHCAQPQCFLCVRLSCYLTLSLPSTHTHPPTHPHTPTHPPTHPAHPAVYTYYFLCELFPICVILVFYRVGPLLRNAHDKEELPDNNGGADSEGRVVNGKRASSSPSSRTLRSSESWCPCWDGSGMVLFTCIWAVLGVCWGFVGGSVSSDLYRLYAPALLYVPMRFVPVLLLLWFLLNSCPLTLFTHLAPPTLLPHLSPPISIPNEGRGRSHQPRSRGGHHRPPVARNWAALRRCQVRRGMGGEGDGWGG